MYDYGRRNYDPAIAKFFNIDRFAEKYYDKSPYHYAANNPIFFVDVQGDSIRVANIGDKSKILTMLHSKTTDTFAFNKSNTLYLAKECTNESGSDYYTNKLIEAIKDPEDIKISINQTFNNAGKIEDVDDAHGGGVTNQKSVVSQDRRSKKKEADVVISGNSATGAKDVNGNTLTQDASDILMHELVGHAIPWITKSDTGDAVKNENKVRTELDSPEREVIPSPNNHKE